MTAPERSPERDAAIDAMLPHVAEAGWTLLALRRGLAEAGLPPDDAPLLFPGGPGDMVEAFCDLADRRMEAAAADADIPALRVSQRVRAILALRFAQNRPWREAVRRGLAVLGRPGHARLAAVCTARTVDSVWHAAQDRSVDFAWYTKRAVLAGVYAATLLRWLADTSEDDADTLAFLDRRLQGVARLSRLRRRPASG